MRVYSWVRFIALGLLGVGQAMRDTPLQRITHGLRSSGECEPLQKYYQSGNNEKLIVLFPEQHTDTGRLVCVCGEFDSFVVGSRSGAVTAPV